MVIGIDWNPDRHQIGISDRHRWNTHQFRHRIGSVRFSALLIERLLPASRIAFSFRGPQKWKKPNSQFISAGSAFLYGRMIPAVSSVSTKMSAHVMVDFKACARSFMLEPAQIPFQDSGRDSWSRGDPSRNAPPNPTTGRSGCKTVGKGFLSPETTGQNLSEASARFGHQMPRPEAEVPIESVGGIRVD
jgi:hypothetical protein